MEIHIPGRSYLYWNGALAPCLIRSPSAMMLIVEDVGTCCPYGRNSTAVPLKTRWFFFIYFLEPKLFRSDMNKIIYNTSLLRYATIYVFELLISLRIWSTALFSEWLLYDKELIQMHVIYYRSHKRKIGISSVSIMYGYLMNTYIISPLNRMTW